MKQPSVGANLSDVAARAGVSVASASRVLSGSKYPVSDEVRKRVLAAAKEELDAFMEARIDKKKKSE